MKAKGAGIILLLLVSISGIIMLGYFMATTEKGTILVLPMLLLLYITYALISTLNALFGTGLLIQTGFDD